MQVREEDLMRSNLNRNVCESVRFGESGSYYTRAGDQARANVGKDDAAKDPGSNEERIFNLCRTKNDTFSTLPSSAPQRDTFFSATGLPPQRQLLTKLFARHNITSDEEKVFDLPDTDDGSSVSLVRGSDHRLKIFSSVCDRGPATLDECQKYQQISCLLTGKEKNVPTARSPGFKYIPIDTLLTVLMAEKDAYIQELREKVDKCTCGEILFKASHFDDPETADDKDALIRKDAEVVALKNKNAVLESELDECRDTVRKAMHKLEHVEGILNENIELTERLKESEEMIKLLEENKKALEEELESIGAQNAAWRRLEEDGLSAEPWGAGDRDALRSLFDERAILKQEMDMLQTELTQARAKAAEMDALKRQSELVLLKLEELNRENEGYRKKLEATKHLEECVEELTKKGHSITEKYKRESQKANEQLKQLNAITKELEIVREEKDLLLKKVADLSKVRSEYLDMKKKLSEFEAIIDENEDLNCKLSEMNDVKLENERMRTEMDKLRLAEAELTETKKKMAEMKRDLESQEEEIQDFVSKIENLSKAFIEQEEYNRLKCEIEAKNSVIQESERQLGDIKDHVDELLVKLQSREDEISASKETMERLEIELKSYKERCEKLEVTSSSPREPIYIATRYEENVKYPDELAVIQTVVKESCPVIEVLKETTEARSDKNDTEEPKAEELLAAKDEQIRHLEASVEELRDSLVESEHAKERLEKLESRILHLQEIMTSYEIADEDGDVIDKLEKSMTRQIKACDFSKRLILETERKLLFEITNKEMSETLCRYLRDELFLSRKSSLFSHLTEVDGLKSEISFLKNVIIQLKEENEVMYKMKVFSEFTGKKALESVLSQLRSELLLLQGMSKPELEAECNSLKSEVKRLVDEANKLKTALDAEKRDKVDLEKELCLIQRQLTATAKARARKNHTNVSTMTSVCTEEVETALEDIRQLKVENDQFAKEVIALQKQCQDFREEVASLQISMNELDRIAESERSIASRQKDEINALNEVIRKYEAEVTELRMSSEAFNQKSIALREELTAKEAEVDRTRKELLHVKNEIVKLNSDVEVLKRKLEEEEDASDMEKVDKGGEDTLAKVEKEFEELRRKLESCRTSEEKLVVLRAKRDNLIVKVKSFESEVEYLKKKLTDSDLVKSELEQLKAEKTTLSNLRMGIESEEKLLSDIFGLREQLRLQQKEIEHARTENADLKVKLHDLGKLLEKFHKGKVSKEVGIATSSPTESENGSWDDARSTRVVDSSTSCERLHDTITMDEFKSEMAKVESRHKLKVQKLKENGAEKIRRLIEQYEKESENRNRAYNESLNNIKSNYETDIRKLVERHKSSILRLQNLHEDEVQELNTNYETQMEAMQTLNENVVNDLTSGVVEKSQLTEKYNKQIDEIEKRFRRLLEEKEARHREEVASLQENLNRNVSELKEMHKQDIDNLSRVYRENMEQLQEKHNRELKKCKKINMKSTDLMRLKYEDLLTEERKKYEEQLQIMLGRLKMGHQGDQAKEDLEMVYVKRARQTIHPEGHLEFNEILHKIIAEGLESLSFDELMLVHCKTCCVTTSFYDEINSRMANEPNLTWEGCPHLALVKSDKEELIKRIFIMENEIAIKQLETHEAIISMDTAEKCRLDELNALLRREREENDRLKTMLTNQTRTQTDLKIESYMLDRQASLNETSLVEKVKELEAERSEKKRLDEELQMERANSKRLTVMLENERQRFKSQREEDSEYIKAMRMRLEEALNHEQIMESQLHYEAHFRKKLEYELQTLQRSFNLIVDQPSTTISIESKVFKDIKNLDQIESEKEEKLCKTKGRGKVKSHKNT